ncbi:MAG: collagen-like protein, partial [Firmicutes bacterium]|nr:collagen-like protein [Bacillota bacterium]
MKKSILAVALVAVMAFTALVLGIVAVAQRPLQGEQGTPGIQGEQGIQGNPGAQGNPGTAGNDGGDGTNGTNGTDGERGARMTVGVAFPIDVILGDSFLNTTTWNLYEVAGLNPTAWTFRGNLFGQTQSGQALMQAEVIAINALIDALQHINGIANLRNAINAIDTRINDWTGYPLIGVNHTELDAQRARLSILEGSALAPVEDILEALRQQLLNATAGMTQQDLADLMVSGIVPV